MKKFNNILRITASSIPKVFLALLLLSIAWTTPVFADRSPEGCTGSGLNIFLYASPTEVRIGDTISYSVTILNGTGVGPVVCDASDITASLVTPDGINHPITLVRTTLLNGESDYYADVVTYTAQSKDVKSDGTMTATANDTGVIHQNDTNSQGGGEQGVNVTVIIPATLHIIKTVINDSGGSTIASGFNLHVKLSGTDVSGSPAAGTSAPGTLYSLNAGTYTVSEDANSLYTQSFSGDCDSGGLVTLSPSEDKTCTITNDDIAPIVVPTTHLIVIKHVINDNGGTALANSFSTTIAGVTTTTPTASGVESPGVDNTLTSVGAYTVDEDAHAGYDKILSADCSGTIALGETKTCTITNDDKPSRSSGGTVSGSIPHVPYIPPQGEVLGAEIVVAPVDVPSFPKTGFFSSKESPLWNNILILGDIMVFFVALFIVFKKPSIE